MTGRGNLLRQGQHQTAERFIGFVFRQRQTEARIEVIHLTPGTEPVMAGAQFHFHQRLAVMLVFDVADELFHDVLHGENAGRAPVLVHHHSKVATAADEFSQDVLNPHRLGHDDGGVKEAGNVGLIGGLAVLSRKDGAPQHVFGMDVADDVVDVAAEGHHLAQAGVGEAAFELLQAGVHLDGDDLVSGNQTVPGLEGREVEGILQDLQLIVQFSFLLRIQPVIQPAHVVVEVDGTQLLFAFSVGLTSEENAAQGQDHSGRGKQEVMQDEEGQGKDPQPTVRSAVEEAFGQEFSRHEHHHRCDAGLGSQRSKGRWRRFPLRHTKQPSAQQPSGFQSEDDQGEVVADQHGRDEALWPPEQMVDDPACDAPGVPVEFGLQPVGRDVGDFHPRKEGGSQQGQQQQDQTGGVRVHGGTGEVSR